MTSAGKPGSSFARIARVVRRVPRGQVATYGQVARLAGLPRGARQVGYALHALPSGSVVPWHRVINAGGRISLPPEAGGIEQRLRLLAEGITVTEAGRVSLARYQWDPARAR
ncbi:MAG: MGMT family protein [Gemmatimonadetes bacterium]|nr:MGMT family protein [Gemmatimonadota bacterium]MBP6668105.1 MGMT family protein [Gemmatimonadales bacterium]MBK7348415.1 MGMT family protein [Gemmatimonadota bacterium]MBK7713985.1 MGMT family protein [Gemmatimonadota bacterium]MBK7783040.1 MGMT family protein [Gemmatimonadota bacterium]